MRKRSLLTAVGLSLLAVALAAPQAAFADPPAPRPLALVGSVTTERVMAAFQGVIPSLGSYEGSTGGPITTKNGTTCVNLARPAGSGSGVDALVQQRDAAAAANRASCIDASRSSVDLRTRASVQNKDLVEVPFAADVVTVGTPGNSGLPTNFSTTTLRQIFTCDPATPAFIRNQVKPLLPQTGSGTRDFFLARIGVAATDVNKFCTAGNEPYRVRNGVDFDGTTPIIENDGRFFSVPGSVGTYSWSDYKFQQGNGGSFGNVALRRVDGNLVNGDLQTLLATPGGPWVRWVYNVVPGQFVRSNDATYAPVFFGANSSICTNKTLIENNGFEFPPNGTDDSGVSVAGCGDTTSVVIPGTVTTAPPSDTV